jgi:hypothetical protein
MTLNKIMSEKITVVIETKNAAFEDAPASEIARILRDMASRVESVGFLPVPRDINGNICGYVTVNSEA